MLSLHSINKNYTNDKVVTEVLKNISFDIKQGEFVAITGPSGSGKSTLMHIIGLLDKPTSGRYEIDSIDASRMSENQLAELRNKKIGFVFQAFNLLGRTTALENVELPLVYAKAKNRKETAREALSSVGLLHRLEHLPSQLSGGEKQRVAIARALAANPAIILADEPTGNLDSKSGKQVMSILQKLNNEGRTIILVTHEQYTAKHAKRIIKIMDGKIIEDSEISERVIAEEQEELVK